MGRLDAVAENLGYHHAENQKLYGDDPLLLGRLEAAYMYGYTKGYAEGREAQRQLQSIVTDEE